MVYIFERVQNSENVMDDLVMEGLVAYLVGARELARECEDESEVESIAKVLDDLERRSFDSVRKFLAEEVRTLRELVAESDEMEDLLNLPEGLFDELDEDLEDQLAEAEALYNLIPLSN